MLEKKITNDFVVGVFQLKVNNIFGKTIKNIKNKRLRK